MWVRVGREGAATQGASFWVGAGRLGRVGLGKLSPGEGEHFLGLAVGIALVVRQLKSRVRGVGGVTEWIYEGRVRGLGAAKERRRSCGAQLRETGQKEQGRR